MSTTAIIIGAGPAGLTAAYELLTRTDIKPIILEKSGEIGGISRTINYKGNRMDMGPHRFFSKSDRVMDWWLKIMPLEDNASPDIKISYQNRSRTVTPVGSDTVPKESDKRMLVIQRLTRIYFLRKFFAYPIQLSFETLRALGLIRTIRIMFSFLWIRIFPRTPETSLEDFIINKFGRELYLLFFKDYTEKVWGIPPSRISAEWGAQRIKGVSLSKAILTAMKSLRNKKKGNLSQKERETSLIEQFLYPKYGPGSLWEEVARQVQTMGGKVYLHQDVQKIYAHDGKVQSVNTINSQTGQTGAWEGDYIFSSMPVQELIAAMDGPVPDEVKEVAAGLQYRDFINVGVLLKQLSSKDAHGKYQKLELKDNWIYIQERDVKVGRLMIYNNWGGGMIKDPNTSWIGMEYFCNKTDEFWALDDEAIQRLAVRELEKMELARMDDVLDITVRRMEKTYPAYFGTYNRFAEIRSFTDGFPNLFLIGRNGMHKYNNSDHSMLTAMVAVDNIIAGVQAKANIWAVNTEQEYHEEKAATTITSPQAPRPLAPAPAFRINSPFLDWLFKNPSNRVWWVVGIASLIIEFTLFKIRFPFANYMPDSYSYLEAAASNADVNMWPVAYSKFLRLISVFTHSDKIVVGIQYFFMQFSAFTFLFTLFYLLKPARVVRTLLIVFFLFNPAILYMSDYISADSLFIGFSFLWLSSLLWVIRSAGSWQIVIQAIFLLACFTLRYNAIIYPVITALAFLSSRYRWYWKLSGITLGVLLVSLSYLTTSSKMQEVTGKRQFSAFGGWQLANNALYMYQNIPAKDREPVPAKFGRLEAMVRQHMDTLNRVKLTTEDTIASRFYLWSSKGPLIQYMVRDWKKDSTTPYFKRWASEAPLYLDYGAYLIRKYPMTFATSVLLPNLGRYALPPAEFLQIYNMGADSVGTLAKLWFNYKSQKIDAHNSKTEKIAIMNWYPILATLINVLYLICVLGMFLFNLVSKKNSLLPKPFLLISAVWLFNAIFSIFASPITLRYQLFPIIITCCIVGITAQEIYYAILKELKKPKVSL